MPSFAKEIQTEDQILSDTWHSLALICFDKRFSFVIQGNYVGLNGFEIMGNNKRACIVDGFQTTLSISRIVIYP